MPTIPASDYTAYVKNKAANVAYQSGTPIAIQTRAQPYPLQSMVNAQVLGSEVGSRVNPNVTTLRPVNGVLSRLVPTSNRYRNNPRKAAFVPLTSILSPF
jgi:hypothetical protein